MKTLAEWEMQVDSELKAKCPAALRNRAGAVLGVIPQRGNWNDFLRAAQESWRLWCLSPTHFPNATLLLYAGLAFYEYEDNRFWPAFSRCLGLHPLPGSQQTIWNEAFEQTASVRGFRFLHGGGHRSFVGTAVYLAGIPLSMWEGFLGVCEWALWQSGWAGLSDSAWATTMTQRLGGHTRLIRFLTENRETASAFIWEMVAARKLLTEDTRASLSDVSPNIDRRYLEEVPETADFLRPQDPDSLLDDKPRLLWRDRRIAIHLPPAIEANSKWECAGHCVPAAAVAGEMPINGKAFDSNLSVTLHCGEQSCTVELPGLQPYGLFDEQRQRFANLKRSRLPTSSYRLISREQLQVEVKDKDWTVEANELQEIEDATQCYVTYLWPVSDRPQLVINGGQPLRFGRRERVNLRIYSGSENSHVLRFGWRDENLMVERLPHLVLEIPCGFLSDEDVSDADMRKEFTVLLDSHVATGSWVWFQHYPENSPEWDYYEWRWGERQALQGSYEVKVFSKRSGELLFGSRRSQRVQIIKSTDEALWPSPSQLGKFWIWALLAQIQHEPTWEEFWIARQAVAGFQELKINQNDWKKLADHGYIMIRRHFAIQKCALEFKKGESGETIARFAGLPNRLYALVQEVRPLRPIRVVEERGLPPCLEVVWPANQCQVLRSICPRERITVVDHLWNR
ncbi:MAG: hypothetical protein WC551_12840 [Patescibacteria group bacterium]